MPTICPKDGRNCPDDLCRGSGVCLVTGAEMWDRCPMCGVVYSEFVECACSDEDDDPRTLDEILGVELPHEKG